MSKHAYLILAHAHSAFLQKLVDSLDHPLNDIYIHWDAKSGSLPIISAHSSTVRFTSRRVNVYWGDFSVVEAEYILFNEARKWGSYQYYHLISGADLPIKSQEEIHRSCSRNPQLEYIGYARSAEKETEWRVNHYFLFPHRFQSKNIVIGAIRKAAIVVQDVFKLRKQQGVFKKGSQWVSVTESFVDYLLEQEDCVRKVFRRTFCPDEIYKQTLCWNSKFRNYLPKTDNEFDGNRRFIKWENGTLVTLSMADVPTMLDSNKWFARKFDHDDQQTINKILSSIC